MKRILLIFLLSALAMSPMRAYDRQWTVYLVQHTHTDIGYTRPQAEILAEHLRYIDYVLDYCDMTSDYPDDAQFRWTCESAWVVAKYLESRPETQVRRLLKHISDGRIEVAAMCFNMAETVDETSLRRSLEALKTIIGYGIHPVTAMQNDVNGIAWSFADWFPELGVKYLWMGEHPHKAYAPFDKPSVFHWQSPSGSDMLAFRSDHYMTGNFWGIEQCDTKRFEDGLNSHIAYLVDHGYQFDAIAVPYSGSYTDNAPPSVKINDFIKEWNETHDNPKLRSAVCHEFPKYIESRYPELLKTFPHAWPDWWTDGFTSAARETELTRNTQALMTSTEGLFSQAAIRGYVAPSDLPQSVSRIQWDLLFYNEHTFGASESISDPLCINTQMQWMGKASYAWTADRGASMLREDAAALVQEGLADSSGPVLAVFNPLAWKRKGYVDVFVDYEIVPADKPFRVVGDDGKALPMQTLSSRSEGRKIRFFVKDLPSLGYRTYRIDLSSGHNAGSISSDTMVTAMENDFYRIVLDSGRGCISSLYDKQRDVELVSPDSPWGMGQFIYETLQDRWTIARLKAEGLERFPLTDIHMGCPVRGSVFDSITMEGCTAAAEGHPLRCEIRLYHSSPRIELVYTIRRARNYDADAVYVAFPFDGGSSSMAFDVQGGEVNPGVNQLEGTSSAWNTIQNYVAVRNDGTPGQALFLCPDTPLAQLGGMLESTAQYFKAYSHPHVFSWVMNNYWTTNFKADQEGEFSWRYVLSSSTDGSQAEAIRTAMEDRMQPYGRILPRSASSNSGRRSSPDLLELSPTSLVPLEVYPSADGKSLYVYIRECSGKESIAKVRINGRSCHIQKADAIERPQGRRHEELHVAGLSNTLIKVDLR